MRVRPPSLTSVRQKSSMSDRMDMLTVLVQVEYKRKKVTNVAVERVLLVEKVLEYAKKNTRAIVLYESLDVIVQVLAIDVIEKQKTSRKNGTIGVASGGIQYRNKCELRRMLIHQIVKVVKNYEFTLSDNDLP